MSTDRTAKAEAMSKDEQTPASIDRAIRERERNLRERSYKPRPTRSSDTGVSADVIELSAVTDEPESVC
jgi:hypothetical protein